MQVRALAFQYIGCPLDKCTPEAYRFAEQKLKIPVEQVLGDLPFKYSYPDLQIGRPDFIELRADFNRGNPRLQLTDLYTVHARQNSDHLGFRIAIGLELAGEFQDIWDLRNHFSFSGKPSSPFKDEITPCLKAWLGKKSDLPIVIFLPESNTEKLINDSVWIDIPIGRKARLERGFPLASYVVHANMNATIETDIQRCDLAMLLALPGFVEASLFEKVRDYRNELKQILDDMKIPADSRPSTLESLKQIFHNLRTSREIQSTPGDIKETLEKYRRAWSNFEVVDVLIPRMNTAMQRIPQKYGEASLPTLIAADNGQLVENSISAAVTATEQVRSMIQAVVNQALEGQTGQLGGASKSASSCNHWVGRHKYCIGNNERFCSDCHANCLESVGACYGGSPHAAYYQSGYNPTLRCPSKLCGCRRYKFFFCRAFVRYGEV